jgi:hypothetical protein
MLAGPNSNDDDVSTHAIVQGLGLITKSAESVSSYNSSSFGRDGERNIWEMHHRSKSSPSIESPSTSQSLGFCNDTASLISCHPSDAMELVDCCSTFREPVRGNHSLELTSLDDFGGPNKQWVARLPPVDQIEHCTIGSPFLYEWDFQSMADPMLPWPDSFVAEAGARDFIS